MFCFRLARFLETAGSVLNYFEPFLGRIEILGSSKRIERVYFEIKESNIEQWEKPQIKVLIILINNKNNFSVIYAYYAFIFYNYIHYMVFFLLFSFKYTE